MSAAFRRAATNFHFTTLPARTACARMPTLATRFPPPFRGIPLCALPPEVSDALDDLRAGREKIITLIPSTSTSLSAPTDVRVLRGAPSPRPRPVILSGSFNPPHAGHIALLDRGVAAASPSEPATPFAELAIVNADKGTLPHDDVTRRLLWLLGLPVPVIVTMSPLFVDKAVLVPGAAFVMGYDTAVRLLRPDYYASREVMEETLGGLLAQGCTFVVGGRVDCEGVFRTLNMEEVPVELRGLFRTLSEETFRQDISSTQLRGQAARS